MPSSERIPAGLSFIVVDVTCQEKSSPLGCLNFRGSTMCQVSEVLRYYHSRTITIVFSKLNCQELLSRKYSGLFRSQHNCYNALSAVLS